MAIDGRELRNAMGLFATGVTVITTRDAAGKPFGLTANAFSSLSLDPPLLLICVDKTVDCYACFDESKVFAVNVLGLDQEDLSTRFATKGIEKFEGVAFHTGDSGVALLDDALVHFECTVEHAYEGGDHTIYVGRIQTLTTAAGDPLLFFQGKYRSLASA